MDTISCIDYITWEQYAKGELSKETLDQLNEHVRSCEVCGDIKEGIDAMRQPSTLIYRVKQINEAVNKKTANKRVVINRWYIALAACLLLITGLTWYVSQKEAPQQVAMVQDVTKPQAEEKPVESSPSSKPKQFKKNTAPKPKTKVENQNMPVDVALVETAKPQIAENTNNVLDDQPKPAAESDGGGESVVTENSTKPDLTENVTLSKATAINETKPSSMATPSVKKRAKISGGKRKASVTAMPNANYKALHADDKSNQIDSVRYFKAKIAYEQHAFDSCVNELLPISNEPSSRYYESGLLLLAKAYIGLNRRYMAEPYLQRVVKLNGKYKQEAVELLEE